MPTFTSLFTTQTPTGTDNSDGSPGITMGTTFYTDVDGFVYGGRFYATATVSGNYTAALWLITGTGGDPDPSGGTLIASKTVTSAGITAGAWNNITFDSPVAITANTAYRIGIFSDAGRYVNTPNFFTTSGVVNGNLHALEDSATYFGGIGVIRQGTFTVNAALAYPTSSFNANSYFSDLLFSTSGGTTPWTKDQAESYRVLNAWTKNAAESYRVLGTFSKNVAESYRVLSAWSLDKAEAYRVYGAFSVDKSDSWRVLNGFVVDKADSWNIAWYRDITDRWRIGDVAPRTVNATAYLGPTRIIANLGPVVVTAKLDEVAP
jgi:uncharacterized protein DUF4082